MELRLEVFGEEIISRKLLRFARNAADMRPAFEALADDFYSIEERQFATEGGFASGGWAPLKTSTIESKRRKGFPPDILVATGDLKSSLTSAFAKGSVKRVSSDSFEIGSNIPYGRFHMKGTKRADGTERMPRRRPVELRLSDRRRWIKILQRWIVSDEIGPEVSESFGLSGVFG